MRIVRVPSQIAGAAIRLCSSAASESASVSRIGAKMFASNNCSGARGSWCATHAMRHM